MPTCPSDDNHLDTHFDLTEPVRFDDSYWTGERIANWVGAASLLAILVTGSIWVCCYILSNLP